VRLTARPLSSLPCSPWRACPGRPYARGAPTDSREPLRSTTARLSRIVANTPPHVGATPPAKKAKPASPSPTLAIAKNAQGIVDNGPEQAPAASLKPFASSLIGGDGNPGRRQVNGRESLRRHGYGVANGCWSGSRMSCDGRPPRARSTHCGQQLRSVDCLMRAWPDGALSWVCPEAAEPARRGGRTAKRTQHLVEVFKACSVLLASFQ
jgi:hypothetical protein